MFGVALYYVVAYDLDDKYGTMRTGSGFRLGIAKATMALHVKGMSAPKR